MTDNQISPRDTLRRLMRFAFIVAAIGFGIKAFLLAPLYVRFGSDITYAEAWWVYLLYYLTDGGVIDLAVFSLVYPTTLYAVWCAGLKASLRLPVFYSVLTLFKFIANYVMTTVTDGALPRAEEFFEGDLPIILGMLALELLQYLLVLLIAVLVKRGYDNRVRIAEGMKLLPRSQQVDYPMPAPALPFTRLFTLKNPLQRASFLVSLVVFLGRFAMHQIYQITLYTQFGFTEGWGQMLIDLVGDVFVGVIFYFVALLLIPHLARDPHARDEQKS